MALASELCVWNGGVSPGELGTLFTTVESDRRRRICLSLLLSMRLSPALVEKSSTTTRLSARPPARRRIAQVHLMSPCLRSERRAPRVQ